MTTQIAQLKLQVGLLSDQLGGRGRQRPRNHQRRKRRNRTGPPRPLPPRKDLNLSWLKHQIRNLQAQAAKTLESVPEKKPTAAKQDMEQQLASRWFVWIGGIAIAIGGLLFVKYAYDNGLISPPLQIVLGLLLGAALVFAGDTLHRKTPATAAAQLCARRSCRRRALPLLSAASTPPMRSMNWWQPTTAFIGLALRGFGRAGAFASPGTAHCRPWPPGFLRDAHDDFLAGSFGLELLSLSPDHSGRELCGSPQAALVVAGLCQHQRLGPLGIPLAGRALRSC